MPAAYAETETGKAARGRWSGGCWDIFAWRGAEVLFVESKQHNRDCVRETQRIGWIARAPKGSAASRLLNGRPTKAHP